MRIVRKRSEPHTLLPPLPSGEGRGEGELRETSVQSIRQFAPSPSRVVPNSPSPLPPLPSPEGRGGKCIVLFIASVLLFPFSIFAENWPQCRGPRTDGTSLEQNIPTAWSPTENIRWKIPIPGKGHSSPIVWNDRLFLTTCLEDSLDRQLLCLDRSSGKILWAQTVLKAPLEQKHNLNSYASATPATDGKYVYVAFFERPLIQLVCYDFDGHEIWRKSPGEFHSVHGFCSSPVLYKNFVILNCDQDAPADIVAYDRGTGVEAWRAPRPNRTRSYCTPLIRKLAGREQLMLSGTKCVASYDPNNGRELWRIDGPTEQFVASLVESKGIVFLTAGFPTYHLLAIDPSGSGNVTNTKVLWHDHRGAAYVPSPIAAGDYFFVVSDDGIASCWEARTGKQMWKHRLGAHHSSSPVSAAGNLYYTSDDGDTYVFKASPKFQLLSTNPLNEQVRASAAISNGDLFLRGDRNLFCIGK